MMGISFKIARTGIKYCPKPNPSRPSSSHFHSHSHSHAVHHDDDQAHAPGAGSKRKRSQTVFSTVASDHHAAASLLPTSTEGSDVPEQGASFSLNLFLDGFSIGKPTEEGKQPPLAPDLTDSLHPYDRKVGTFFQAIEGGWFPGDILGDIPCKYVDGGVICEVRDYRSGLPKSGDSVSSGEALPRVHKIFLRPTMENIVKDILSMAEESWSYSDFMEIESRILKAMRPKLRLDPTPMLDRLCDSVKSNKVKLGVPITRRERTRRASLPSTNATSNEVTNGKKASQKVVERENSQMETVTSVPMVDDPNSSSGQGLTSTISGVNNGISYSNKSQANMQATTQNLSKVAGPGSLLPPPTQSTVTRPRFQHLPGNHSPISSPSGSTLNTPSSAGQEWNNSLMEARTSSVSSTGKRDYSSIMNNSDGKRGKHEFSCIDKQQQQNVVQIFDSGQGREQFRIDPAIFFGDMNSQRHSQQLTIDDERQVAHREASVQEAKISSHIAQKNQGIFKIKEELDIDKSDVSYIKENQDIDRTKDQHLSIVSNEQLDQQTLSQQNLQHGKLPYQWHSVHTRDDIRSPKDQKPDIRSSLQSPSLSKSVEMSLPISSAVAGMVSSPSSFQNSHMLHGQQKEKPIGTASGTGSMVVSSNQHDTASQQAQQALRRRSEPLPKTPTTNGVASPCSVTNSMTPSNVNSPSTCTTSMSNPISKTDNSQAVNQNKAIENLSILVAIAKRHNLPSRIKKMDEFEDVRQVPSLRLLANAFDPERNSDDQMEASGHGFMMNLHMGKGLHVWKTRIMNFERSEQSFQGNPTTPHKSEVILKMVERTKEDVVEAAVQYNCDNEDACLDVLPSLPNVHIADRLAAQFKALMFKEGFKLTSDQISPGQPARMNLPSAAPMAAVANALTGNMSPLPSARVVSSQNMAGAGAGAVTAGGIPQLNSMQFPSASQLASVRMPPPGNAPARQPSSAFLQSGLVNSSKSLPLDASQFAMAQQQQQPLRSQPIVPLNSLGQLTTPTHASNQQLPNSVHLQMLQQRQQQHQHQQQQMQRKILGLGSINAVNGISGGVGMSVSGGPQTPLHSMVGMNGMNSIMGMGTVNGISPTMVSGLNSICSAGTISQNPGIGSIMGHNLRPGSINQQAITLAAKGRMVQGRARPGVISTSPMSGISVGNQVHTSVGLAMMGQNQVRGNNVSTIPRTPTTGMGPPKLATSNIGSLAGQNFYLNQQLGNQAQQITSQPQLNMQQASSSQQQLLNSQPSLLNMSHQLSQQQQQQATQLQHLNAQQQQLNPQQQFSSQQMSPQPQMNSQQYNSPSQLNSQQQQISAGNLGSLVGGPASPQHSSQTLGSVSSIASSPPMELQSATRANSMTAGQ